jgi:predicted transcriptional regulator
VNRRLGPVCRDVLDTLRLSDLPCTAAYVREDTGRTHAAVNRALYRLERLGHVVRAGVVPRDRGVPAVAWCST